MSKSWRYIGGDRGTAPLILNLGNRWRWVANLMPRLLCLPVKNSLAIQVEGGWVSEPVWMFSRKIFVPAGTGARDVKSVSQSLQRTFYAGPYVFKQF
jgi:hypothetical protein